MLQSPVALRKTHLFHSALTYLNQDPAPFPRVIRVIVIRSNNVVSTFPSLSADLSLSYLYLIAQKTNFGMVKVILLYFLYYYFPHLFHSNNVHKFILINIVNVLNGITIKFTATTFGNIMILFTRLKITKIKELQPNQ